MKALLLIFSFTSFSIFASPTLNDLVGTYRLTPSNTPIETWIDFSIVENQKKVEITQTVAKQGILGTFSYMSVECRGQIKLVSSDTGIDLKITKNKCRGKKVSDLMIHDINDWIDFTGEFETTISNPGSERWAATLSKIVEQNQE